MSREDKNTVYEEVLSVYREGDEQCCPEDFREALQALDSDGELKQWFDEDQAFDADFRAALAEVAVPKSRWRKPEKVQRRLIPFIKLAAAAALAVVLGGVGMVQYQNMQDQRCAALVTELREGMAAFAASSFELDAMNNDLESLRKLITSNGGSQGKALEQVFAQGMPMGCKVIDWDGRTVSLYCFGNDKGQVVHAFVLPLNELNGARAAAHLKSIVAYAERDTGGFIVDDTAYLLVASMPGVDIKPFLLPAQEAYALCTPEAVPNALIAIITLPRS